MPPESKAARGQGNRHNESPEERARRSQAINDELRSISTSQILGLFNLGQGVRGGPGWMKYKVGGDLHLNINTESSGFKVLERTPIPPLMDRNSKAKDGGRGAIDLFIALSYFEGSCPADPKEARKFALQRLQETFAPHTLNPNYSASGWKPKERAPATPPKPDTPIELPAVFDNFTPLLTAYLTKTRGLPLRLVEHLITQRMAYPSLHEYYEDVEGKRTRVGAHPVMVTPITQIEKGFPVAYEHKEIPRDLRRKTKGITSGPKANGVMMLGPLNSKTRFLKITEAPIDAFSKWVIDKPGPDTCIVATIGARFVPSLVEAAKKFGIEVSSCNDCDATGTRVTRTYEAECKKLGVRHKIEQPGKSEARFELLKNTDARTQQRVSELEKFCREKNLPFKVVSFPDSPKTVAVIPNTIEVWDKLRDWYDEDRLALNSPHLEKAAREHLKANPPMTVTVTRNKDWNDMLVKNTPPMLDWDVKNPAPSPVQPNASTPAASSADQGVPDTHPPQVEAKLTAPVASKATPAAIEVGG